MPKCNFFKKKRMCSILTFLTNFDLFSVISNTYFMAWKKVILSKSQTEAFQKTINQMTVEKLMPESVLEMTNIEQQELVDSTKEMASDMIDGRAQYFDGTLKDLFKELTDEINTFKHTLRTQRKSKIRHS